LASSIAVIFAANSTHGALFLPMFIEKQVTKASLEYLKIEPLATMEGLPTAEPFYLRVY